MQDATDAAPDDFLTVAADALQRALREGMCGTVLTRVGRGRAAIQWLAYRKDDESALALPADRSAARADAVVG